MLVTQVWKTLRGSRYHSTRTCPGIADGHAEARSHGYANHEPELVDLAGLNGDIRPCSICWVDHFAADRWLPAQLETEVKADSPFEINFYNQVLRHLAPPLDPDYLRVQEEIVGLSGTSYRVDFAIDRPGRKRIAIEIDGHQKVSDQDESDERRQSLMSARQNDLVNAGWEVLRFTNRQVAVEPGKCRTVIEQALVRSVSPPQWQATGSRTEVTVAAPPAPTATASRPGASSATSLASSQSGDSALKAAEGAKRTKILLGGAAAAVALIGVVIWMNSGQDDAAKPDSSGNCPSSYPIKGNVSGEDRIYHEPGSEFYTRTRAEDCFASTTDAEDAGYRASRAG